jgi:hypothetical protein
MLRADDLSVLYRLVLISTPRFVAFSLKIWPELIPVEKSRFSAISLEHGCISV